MTNQLFRWGNDDISVFNRPMVSLQKDWSWFSFLAVQRSASDTRDDLVVDDGLAIGHNCNPPANQGDVINI
ncbi:MAG: hypothetical protein RIT36_1352, partial [Bacteroidota bacterium]